MIFIAPFIGVLNRCTHVRVNGQKVPLTPKMTQRIVDQCVQYGTGRDTLRCLALGTIDSPPQISRFNLIFLIQVVERYGIVVVLLR